VLQVFARTAKRAQLPSESWRPVKRVLQAASMIVASRRSHRRRMLMCNQPSSPVIPSFFLFVHRAGVHAPQPQDFRRKVFLKKTRTGDMYWERSIALGLIVVVLTMWSPCPRMLEKRPPP
jgi:hypothetical protein